MHQFNLTYQLCAAYNTLLIMLIKEFHFQAQIYHSQSQMKRPPTCFDIISKKSENKRVH
jgi:hypothetical protein